MIRKTLHATPHTALALAALSLAAALALLYIVPQGGIRTGVGFLIGVLYGGAMVRAWHARMEWVHMGLVREALRTKPPSCTGCEGHRL